MTLTSDSKRGLIETAEDTFVINPLTEQLSRRVMDEAEPGQPHLILKRSLLTDYSCPHSEWSPPGALRTGLQINQTS